MLFRSYVAKRRAVSRERLLGTLRTLGGVEQTKSAQRAKLAKL